VAALDLFSQPTRAWFEASFEAPTDAQTAGWEAIAEGSHTLIHAPTGSGKTLAAFLWCLDRLFSEPLPADAERTRVLYVSPMKALAYDIERNLRAPLAGISNAAGRMGLDQLPEVVTAMRTGDTSAQDRRKLHRHPPDVLITTPESLYLMLTSRIRETLASVRWLIVDEIHAVAGTKRGSHLALSLERLEEIASSPQRIGLSATQRPLADIAKFLGGGTVSGNKEWTLRRVAVVDAPPRKTLDLEVVVPVEDMTQPQAETELVPGGAAALPPKRSMWPTMYARMLELIRAHNSTIIFANSRALAERIARQVNELAEEELVQAHHGSVSREQRLEIEDRLKRGELKAVVATATLELGIDMAAVDLVLMVESPPSVASGLQRAGRAGHQVGAPSMAKIFPKHRGDLLEAAVVVDRMLKGQIESTSIPRNPLDVLAQQIVAAASVEPWDVDALYDMVRRAGPYSELGRASFESVLDMLAGRYPSDEFAELRPRITWDRVKGRIEARPGAQILAVTNAGTIPDRGLYRVMLPDGGKVGELDEEMVYESRPGDVFLLGSSAWQMVEIDADRVVVAPAAAGTTPRLPFWRGDGLGRPVELGRAIGEFLRELAPLAIGEATKTLVEEYRLDPLAARNLAVYLDDEKEATGIVPTDKTLVIQQFRDEIGDWRMVLLSPFGARVHAPWALAASRRMRERFGIEADGVWSDDGIVFRFPDAESPPDPSALILDPEEVEDLVVAESTESALFASRFREAAARALLLPRRRPDRRTPLWLQRRRSQDLLKVARNYGSFPILLETYREVLQDHFDLPALGELLSSIRSRNISVTEVATERPSPFASSLLFDFIATYMYEYDSPIAERRATALTLDRDLLQELLGEPELRSLLDADSIARVELELQRLTRERQARNADGLHDLLRHLGPLSPADIEARVTEPDEVENWLASLENSGRVFRTGASSDQRWAAAEDAARLRDALGLAVPKGIAADLLKPVDDPLGDVVGRFARTHAPFTTEEAAVGLGLPSAVMAGVLERLAGSGRVVRGAFRPSGADQEWADTDVIRRIRRASLAVLRNEAEPVEPAAFARLQAEWQGLGTKTSGSVRLGEVIRSLQGASLPASALEVDLLPARLSYSPEMLDQLTASGEVVWVGMGPLGPRDGRVALYLRDDISLLHPPVHTDPPVGEMHDAIRAQLTDRGASFFRDIYRAAGGGDTGAVLDALWDLVWSGEVTNDTVTPLRAFLWGKVRSKGRGRGRPRLPSSAPPSGSGRWYLVSDLIDPEITDTVKAKAMAEQLLERHGLLTRDVVSSSGVPGGFSGLYPVLRAMEDAGRVRRGYFVEGLGGAQFALPGAVDQLRREEEPEMRVLAATDPASPYGSAIPWPQSVGNPSRSAGAFVITHGGELVAFLERGARTLVTFTSDDGVLRKVASVLAQLTAARARRFELEQIDGMAASGTPLGRLLEEAGFKSSYKGLVLRS